MALGVEMMLKSLGLDPEEVKKSIAGIGQIMADLKTGIDKVQVQNAEILARLDKLEKGANDG